MTGEGTMRRTTYREITGRTVGFYGLLAVLGIPILLALAVGGVLFVNATFNSAENRPGT